MPIYEYYCPDNHRIYQFYAKTLAQGRTIPKCPDDPRFRLVKLISAFAAITGGGKDEPKAEGREPDAGSVPAPDSAEDARMEAAMNQMEGEFSSVDENDPRAMGRMMRRMADLTGEKLDGEMEEVVRKLEEGADPDSLEDQFGDAPPGGGGGDDPDDEGPAGPKPADDPREPRARLRARRGPPTRDPKLYDYE